MKESPIFSDFLGYFSVLTHHDDGYATCPRPPALLVKTRIYRDYTIHKREILALGLGVPIF
jgi:hypothetical protein